MKFSILLFFLFSCVQANLLFSMEDYDSTYYQQNRVQKEFKFSDSTCLSRCSDQNLWRLACCLFGVGVGGLAAISSYVFYSHYVQGEAW